MLPTLINDSFSDPGWIYETNWDGYRALCFISNGECRLVSRNQIDMTAAFPELCGISGTVAAKTAVIDGEIVALRPDGLPSFQLLQGRLSTKNAKGSRSRIGRIIYYAFDLVYCDGFNLQHSALVDRKNFLSGILQESPFVRYSDHIDEEGDKLYKIAAAAGLEGIVAKKRNSAYVEGRTREWLKIKPERTALLIVCGYTDPQNSRQYLGGLVVGAYDRGDLMYSGRVGSGFSREGLKEAFETLQPLRTESSPFATVLPVKDVSWVRPQLVAEVRYLERTNAGELRHPVFVAWRKDKKPQDCSIEQFLDGLLRHVES
jgi:bifunctional non-homologous end joining protein LigD